MRHSLKKNILYPIIGALAFMFSFIVFFVNSPNSYAATTIVEVVTLTKEIMLNNMNEYSYGELYGGKVTINGINFRWNRMLPSGNNLTLPSNYDNYFVAEGLDQTISLLDISMTFGNTNSGNLVFDVSDRFVFNESLSGKTGYSKFNVAATGYNRNSVCLLFDRTGDSPETELIVTSLTLTLKAEVTTEKVTLDKQSGSGGSSSIDAAPGSAMPSITVPTRDGYTFGGYYTGKNGSGTKYYNADGSSATNWVEGAATTLYAKWTANQYTVTLNKNEGTGGTDSVTATYNSAMPAITSLPTRENYDFAGYFDSATNGTKYYNEDGTSAKNWDKTTATTLYAHWQVNVDGVIAFINDIGNVQYTPTSKGLIDAANTAYESLDSAQKLLVTNYDVLVQANLDYDKVDESVGKVNAIGAVEYTTECKALIDAARTTYDALTDYQKSIYPENTLKALVDAEKPYDVMDKINAIGEIENTKDCKDKIEAAKSAYDALTADQEALVYDSFVKILNDDVAAFNVIEKINESSNVKYTKESKDLIDNTKTLYSELTDEQKELVVNYDSLLKAEADYKEVDKVAKEINNIGDITYNEESNNKITSARASYEELTEDQKAFFPEDEVQSLVDYETTYVVLEKIYAIGDVEYTHESEDRIEEARNIYDSLTPEQKELINDDDLHMLIQSEDDYSSKETTGTVWLVLFMILAINALIGGLFFIFFLLWKRDDDDDEENKPNTVTTMSIAPLGLLFLTSHLTDGGFITLYVIVGLAILSWIGVLVIYILKKKDIIKPCITINGNNSKTEDKTDNEEVESPKKDEESQE